MITIHELLDVAKCSDLDPDLRDVATRELKRRLAAESPTPNGTEGPTDMPPAWFVITAPNGRVARMAMPASEFNVIDSRRLAVEYFEPALANLRS